MAYKLSYTGPKIDEILEKSTSFDINDEAWTVINGIDTLSMDRLMKPGNYVFNGRILLPEMDYLYEAKHEGVAILARSALIFVKQINQNIHQFISYVSIDTKYTTNVMIAWIKQSDYSYIPYLYHHGDYSSNLFSMTENTLSEKYRTKFDKQLRVFTDDGYLQYYDQLTDAYKDILTTGMSKEVYGNINNAFTTADNLINTALNNNDFTEHPADTEVHVTDADKTTLKSKAYKDELVAALDTKKAELKTSIETACASLKDTLSSFIELITNQGIDLTNHDSDSVKHPSTEQINNWNSKSEADHTHTIDEIEIDTDHIEGEYTLDLLKKAIQRHHTVTTNTELLALTTDTVQLHDWVFLNDPNYPILYQITDESKLGTMGAFTQLVTDNFDDSDLIWSNISNKPTTVDDLGVTYVPNEYTDGKLTDMGILIDETTKTIESVENNFGLLDQKSYAHSMETLIDIIDNKMKIVNEILG